MASQVTGASQTVPRVVLEIFQSASLKNNDAIKTIDWLRRFAIGSPSNRDAQVDLLIEAIQDPSLAQRVRSQYFQGYSELGISNDDLGKPILEFIKAQFGKITGHEYALAEELGSKKGVVTLRDLLEADLSKFKDKRAVGRKFFLRRVLEAINKAYDLTVHESYRGVGLHDTMDRLVTTTEPLTLKSVLVKGKLPINLQTIT